MAGRDARKLQDKCPKCGKAMTQGVEERVDELADRREGYVPKNAIGYRHLLPLSETIAFLNGDANPGSRKTWETYNSLIDKFGSEYAVMLDVPGDQLTAAVGVEISKAVLRVRNDDVFVQPGYDGVYGKLDLARSAPSKTSGDGQPEMLASWT